MAKNKKKTTNLKSIKPSTSVGSTTTITKRPSKNVERAANIAKGIAIAAIPVGRGASIAGKIISKVVSPKMTSAGRVTKTRTFTQGPKAKIEAKAPKGAAAYSPIKGSKVKVTWDTQGLSVRQQQNVTALTTGQKARTGLNVAKGAAAGAVATQSPKSKKGSVTQQSKSKKASQKKKK